MAVTILMIMTSVDDEGKAGAAWLKAPRHRPSVSIGQCAATFRACEQLRKAKEGRTSRREDTLSLLLCFSSGNSLLTL